MTQTELTKEQKVDAAVAVVQARAARALHGAESVIEYIEADAVADALAEQGVLARQATDTQYSNQERARKRLTGQAKRLLDEAAAQGRILRFSSVDNVWLPRLDGTRRGLYGQAVGYTTPELYEQAAAAVEQAQAKVRAEQQAMEELLGQAKMVGLPEPVRHTSGSVSYDVDGLRALIALAGG